MNKHIQRGLVAVGVLASAAAANAAGPDFTTLTTAVDFSTVATAILAIAALMIVPGVVKWGARRVLSMVGR
jgi:hypothetical protein